MEKTNMKILGWTIGMLVIVALILTIGLTTTFIRASGRFNLPLSWILSPSGVSVDLDNNGIVDNVDSVPSGLIAMFDTDCPSGWTRVTALDGKFLVASSTYNASAGGSDSITLAEANLPSHTHGVGTLAAANESAHTHGDGSLGADSGGSHGHSITDSGHTHAILGVGGTATAAEDRVRNYGNSNRNNAITVSAITGISVNSGGAHAHTISGTTAAGSAHTHTLSGSTGGTGSGTSFDNRPAYATIVICQKD